MRSAIFAALTLAAAPVFAAGPVARCDENCLLETADTFMNALTADDPSTVPFASSLRSTENGAPVPPGKGIWLTGAAWSYRHTFVDHVTGQIGIFGSLLETDGTKAVVTVRLKVTDRKIGESEILLTRPGEAGLVSTQQTEAKPIFGTFVPPEYRSTRAQLAEIPRLYFEGIRHGDPTGVPFHPDCNRVENGVQTTDNPPRFSLSCPESLLRSAYMQTYREFRVPVIDTARGLVWAITAFDMPAMHSTTVIHGKPYEISPERQNLPRTLLLYELFKVEGGKIRAIEAQMRNVPLGAGTGWADAK